MKTINEYAKAGAKDKLLDQEGIKDLIKTLFSLELTGPNLQTVAAQLEDISDSTKEGKGKGSSGKKARAGAAGFLASIKSREPAKTSTLPASTPIMSDSSPASGTATSNPSFQQMLRSGQSKFGSGALKGLVETDHVVYESMKCVFLKCKACFDCRDTLSRAHYHFKFVIRCCSDDLVKAKNLMSQQNRICLPQSEPHVVSGSVGLARRYRLHLHSTLPEVSSTSTYLRDGASGSSRDRQRYMSVLLDERKCGRYSAKTPFSSLRPLLPSHPSLSFHLTRSLV